MDLGDPVYQPYHRCSQCLSLSPWVRAFPLLCAMGGRRASDTVLDLYPARLQSITYHPLDYSLPGGLVAIDFIRRDQSQSLGLDCPDFRTGQHGPLSPSGRRNSRAGSHRDPTCSLTLAHA